MSISLRTLIVEDSVADAALFVRELRRGGYEPEYERVDTRESMAVALDRQSWDIVISDYEIPGFSGPDALHLVQERELDIPFIMITGKVGEDVAVEAMKLGASDYILKQNLTRLVPAIRRELRDAEVRRERKRVEEALEEERARLRATLSSIPDELWITDTAGRILMVSDSAYGSLGKTGWQDIYAILQELEVLYPDGTPRSVEDAPLFLALRGEVLRNRIEIIRNLQTGELRWREVSSSPVRDAEGNIIGAVAIARDVTRQKQAEENLRKSEERFRSIFTSNVVALAIWDVHGNLLDVNDRFLEILGYTREEFEVGKVRWDEATPPEMRQRDYDATAELVAGRDIEPYEKEFQRPDGTRVPVLIGGRILPGTSQEIGVAFAMDITKRRRAEEALIAKNKELDDFAYTVSHDLKAPLNLISGYIQLANESPDRSAEILSTISEQAVHLANIIDALLKMSRAGRVISKKEEVSLGELINTSYSVGTVNADNVELRNKCDIPIVCGDPTRLGQIFTNLITNSVRYRDPEKDIIIIEIFCLPEGDLAKIGVKDNGAGIEPDVIDKIFTPAFTTRKSEGTGFGLAIVKKIAEAHGGSIRVESKGKGKGATFYVALPG